MKRILILTSDMGGGHKSASSALSAEFLKKNAVVKGVELKDWIGKNEILFSVRACSFIRTTKKIVNLILSV